MRRQFNLFVHRLSKRNYTAYGHIKINISGIYRPATAQLLVGGEFSAHVQPSLPVSHILHLYAQGCEASQQVSDLVHLWIVHTHSNIKVAAPTVV